MVWRGDGNGRWEERALLGKAFPGSEWRTVGDEAVFLCRVATRSGRGYDLRLVFAAEHPDEMPRVLVVQPQLQDAAGEYLVFRGADPTMMLAAPESGMVSIAHTKPGCWSRRGSALLALTKARSWLEAYEGHLASGLAIVSYLERELASGGR